MDFRRCLADAPRDKWAHAGNLTTLYQLDIIKVRNSPKAALVQYSETITCMIRHTWCSVTSRTFAEDPGSLCTSCKGTPHAETL